MQNRTFMNHLHDFRSRVELPGQVPDLNKSPSIEQRMKEIVYKFVIRVNYQVIHSVKKFTYWTVDPSKNNSDPLTNDNMENYTPGVYCKQQSSLREGITMIPFTKNDVMFDDIKRAQINNNVHFLKIESLDGQVCTYIFNRKGNVVDSLPGGYVSRFYPLGSSCKPDERPFHLKIELNHCTYSNEIEMIEAKLIICGNKRIPLGHFKQPVNKLPIELTTETTAGLSKNKSNKQLLLETTRAFHEEKIQMQNRIDELERIVANLQDETKKKDQLLCHLFKNIDYGVRKYCEKFPLGRKRPLDPSQIADSSKRLVAVKFDQN